MLTTYGINKAVNEKKLTTTQIGNTRYYSKNDIESFLENNKKKNRKLII